MATVRRRAWTTRTGERREAWRVRYVDQHGIARTRQFDLKRDADAFRIRAEGEVVAGIHTADRASVTVAKAADLWIATAEANGCDRSTLKTYGEMARVHIKPLLGDEKLSRLTAPKVVGFRDALLETRSHAMAAKAVRHLSMILGDAVERGLVAQNVARGVKVKRPRADGLRHRLAKRAEIPPKAHLKALIAAADRAANRDPALPVMVRLAMLAGPRQSELRALPWSLVDLAAGEVTIAQRADRWNAIGPPKSAAGTRTIPIGPTLVAMLKAWKLRCPPNDQDLVFPNRAKRIVQQHDMAAKLLRLQIEAGVAVDTGTKTEDGETVWKARYGWHDLRHAAASAWIAQGVDLKRLQVWIGHENIQLTIDVYGHLIKDAKRDAELAQGSESALLA